MKGIRSIAKIRNAPVKPLIDSDKILSYYYMTTELQNIINTYQRSKIIRLGVCYLESDIPGQTKLSKATGLELRTLRHYSMVALNYWPKAPFKYENWADEEDNYLMDHYQTSTLKRICSGLPNRTRAAIISRARVLGVTRER